mmetsp:Transcript_10307/g.40073  ORF Transcript_10307/g.40073 Transcript_10307/m.40073 type:complete len:355 (+) Transcript_10307:492-1556(+)
MAPERPPRRAASSASLRARKRLAAPRWLVPRRAVRLERLPPPAAESRAMISALISRDDVERPATALRPREARRASSGRRATRNSPDGAVKSSPRPQASSIRRTAMDGPTAGRMVAVPSRSQPRKVSEDMTVSPMARRARLARRWRRVAAAFSRAAATSSAVFLPAAGAAPDSREAAAPAPSPTASSSSMPARRPESASAVARPPGTISSTVVERRRAESGPAACATALSPMPSIAMPPNPPSSSAPYPASAKPPSTAMPSKPPSIGARSPASNAAASSPTDARAPAAPASTPSSDPRPGACSMSAPMAMPMELRAADAAPGVKPSPRSASMWSLEAREVDPPPRPIMATEAPPS